ncbi:YDG domain-containing protein, partial [Rhizobium sp. ERR 942]
MTPQTNRRTFSNGVLSHRTRTHKVRLVALLASTALAHATVAPAQSLPSGGQVAAGSVTIGTPSAGALTINQTSGSAVVNWQSFNVGKANRVTFVQPDANAAILNRVTGETSSTISGQINANGQVYLINPNGIAITSSGTVKAGAFVASTLGISDDDFMGGKRTFTGNGASAPVTNTGAITINRGGYMALIGGTVANAGVITVPMGKAALGSGEQATLDLSGDGFLQVAVPTKAGGSGALVDNSGKIAARGGTVQLTAAAAKDMARQAVNMSGTIEANGVSGKSGDITLTGGDGEVAVSGSLDAGNAAGTGGKVTVTGRSIKLASAKVNASGKTGGGTVNIGGNRQGKGPLQHAETLDVDAHTVINANAVTMGTGGNVVLWSDDLTNFAGTITAKGGAISGNGGEAEVSGKAKLSYTGLTDLTAAHGSFGNLLLDPYNVTISTATDSNTDGGFNATGNDSVINVNTLTNALQTANVTVTTGSSSDANNPQAGTITIAAPIAWNAPTTLTLAAASDININAAISAHNSGLIVSSGGTITTTAAVDIGAFILASGSWVQNGAVLPAFSAQDFRITNGTSFLRVTGGDGTSATPYTVADIYGLQGIGSSSANLASYWTLANNIDASGTANWNAGAGFVPIGTESVAFTGSFNGGGNGISGLTINRSGTSYVGLFGYAAYSATISNVGLVDGSISGMDFVGALAGENDGTISNAYATGRVSGGTYVGGLAGWNTGTISNSHATGGVSGATYVGGLGGINSGTISYSYATGGVSGATYVGGLGGINSGTISYSYAVGAVSGNRIVGGLVGENDATISNAYATGTVSESGGGYTGGLVGFNNGAITNAYATGAVNGSVAVGGLTGYNLGSIDYAYATGAVSGSDVVGGLVGQNTATIANAYATGAVSGGSRSGGLVGFNLSSGTMTSSYWDMETTGQSSACGVAWSACGATGLTTGQARSASSYSGWDFGGVWYQVGDMRPILRSEAATADSNGVASIWNLHQLALIGANLTGNYTLANNIDASETSGANASGVWSTGGWVPLANINTMFSGSLNGNNHTISGLTVTGYDQVGLFAVSAGSISNLGLVGGSVAGVRSNVGALAGWNYGTISNSYSTATVSGLFEVGGLVGMNIGTISSSYATGSVSGSNVFVGGLVGYNSGAIINAYATGAVSGGAVGTGGLVGNNSDRGGTINSSYATGSVSGGSRTGGLAGDNGGTITNAYASGAVSGTDTVGGLVGGNYAVATISNSYAIGAVTGGGGLTGQNDGTVTASFWDMATTGQVDGTTSGSSTGMTGITTAQMADPFSFINAGWDFANVWGKSTSGANGGYMMLRSLSSGLYDDYVKIGSGTRAYGDANSMITGATLSGAGTSNVSLSWGGAIAGTTNAGTYNYSDPNIVSVTENGPRTAYIDYSGTLTISQRVLSLTGSRTYDGTTNVAAGNLSLDNFANGETLTLTGAGSMADKNAGTGKVLSVGTLSLSNGSGLASNYTLIGGTDTVDIAKATISDITGITAINRTYDGTTNAALNTAGAVFNGMIAGDSMTVSGGTGAFADKNVGTGKTVSISSLSLGGTDAGNYTLTSNTATTTADIAKATISAITGITADNKTYDGTTNVALNTAGAGFTGMVAGDALTVATSSGAFADKNAGTGKVVNISGLTLGGADVGNYTLASDTATTTADIAKATISAITGITANNKTYNGNTTAVLNTSGAGFTGMIAGDSLTVSGGTGAFADKNVGTGKTVSISSLLLGGTDAGNYTLTSNTATATANITKATISDITGITAINRTYDGTTNAALNTSGAGFTGMIAGDNLTVSSGTGAFADKNVGTGKTVSISSLSLGGTDAGNYTLASNTATATADITKATISAITGITAGNKTYDGTTNVALNTAGAVFNGMIAGDSLTVGTALGAFSNASAGTGKTVGISGLMLGGVDAQNYRLDTNTATTLADIGQRVVNLSGSRTYNGSTDLDASIFTLSNLVGGETLTLSGTGTMSDKNAGSGKGVTLASLALGDGTNGGLASNYTLAGGTDTVDIARAMISSIGGITANGKMYDGTTDATLNTAGAVFNGMVSGDTLSLGNGFSGAFSDKNAGTGKTVTISGLSLAGADAGNYTLASNMATTLADIAKRAITVTADGAHRTYGDANPGFTYTVGGSGLVAGDTLSGALVTSATTASGIGHYGITLGTLANSNYDISFTGANLTVTPRALTVTADAKSKIYGDANPALTYTTSGLVNNDTLSGSLVTSAGQYSGVGGYAITLGSLGNANYAITYNAANLTVTPRAMTVTADAKSKTYGDANPALTYTTSGLVNGDMLSGSLSTSAGQYSNVGSYGITLGSLGNANYAITYNAANLTVTPRAMTVTADAKSKTYGDAN